MQEGFPTSPCILDLGPHGSSCWAVPQPRLFCPIGSSTHTSRTGSSEFPTFIITRQFGPSGGRVSSLTQYSCIARILIPLHGATVRGRWSGKSNTFCVWGKVQAPLLLREQAWTQILFSFAEPVAAGKKNGKTLVGCAQKTS